MDAIVMIEDDNNTSSSVHSLSNTKSNNSNYFFEGKQKLSEAKFQIHIWYFSKSQQEYSS